MTNNTRKLTGCFKNSRSFPDQIKNWQNNLKSCIVQSFQKIRSKNRKFCETNVGKLLEERKRTKLDLATNPSELKEKQKISIEEKISKATEYEYMKKVKKTLSPITGEDGGINTNGLWKAKLNLIPKDKSNNPVALKDNKGNMITNPEGVKKLCVDEITERL